MTESTGGSESVARSFKEQRDAAFAEFKSGVRESITRAEAERIAAELAAGLVGEAQQ